MTLDEIVTMVNMALGTAGVSVCRAGDVSGEGTITVEEIVQAVNKVLLGC